MEKFFSYKYKESNNEQIKVNENIDELVEIELEQEIDVLDDECYQDNNIDDNIKCISDIDELATIIKAILELSWGKDWGEIIPEFIEDDTNPVFPKIVYDVNNRELSEHSSKKPTLYNHIKEVVDGVETGDGFNIYRQWYDTIVEFNFIHHTIKDARKLMHDFEKVINTYIGLIKSKGLSEMMYLEEIPTEKSIKYKPGIPMKANAYYVRFEVINKVRTSLLKEIEYIIKSEGK